jgi:hypothetical protein
VKIVTNETSLNPQMTQIDADEERGRALMRAIKVAGSVNKFRSLRLDYSVFVFNLRPSVESADCQI